MLWVGAVVALVVHHVVIVAGDADLIPAGSVWLYNDSGANLLDARAFAQPSFNDTSWRSGSGPFGYGDTDTITTLGFGPEVTRKYITNYFRIYLEVTDLELLYAPVQVMAQYADGVRCFLNGVEVGRANMPSSTIFNHTVSSTCRNLATSSVFANVGTAAARLRLGTNVLACDLHRCNFNSQPRSRFDALLRAIGVSSATPSIGRTSSPSEPAVPSETASASLGAAVSRSKSLSRSASRSRSRPLPTPTASPTRSLDCATVPCSCDAQGCCSMDELEVANCTVASSSVSDSPTLSRTQSASFSPVVVDVSLGELSNSSGGSRSNAGVIAGVVVSVLVVVIATIAIVVWRRRRGTGAMSKANGSNRTVALTSDGPGMEGPAQTQAGKTAVVSSASSVGTKVAAATGDDSEPVDGQTDDVPTSGLPSTSLIRAHPAVGIGAGAVLPKKKKLVKVKVVKKPTAGVGVMKKKGNGTHGAHQNPELMSPPPLVEAVASSTVAIDNRVEGDSSEEDQDTDEFLSPASATGLLPTGAFTNGTKPSQRHTVQSWNMETGGEFDFCDSDVNTSVTMGFGHPGQPPPKPPSRRGFRRVTAIRAMLQTEDGEGSSGITGGSDGSPTADGKPLRRRFMTASLPLDTGIVAGCESPSVLSKGSSATTALPLDTGVISTM